MTPRNIITLSGWGQPYDALSVLAPDAIHVDYAKHNNIADALAAIAQAAKTPDLMIGWSLGGQLIARAIHAGLVRPRKLVLIAAPFQFVATSEAPFGMKRDLYDKFRDNYAKNPERTLQKAWALVIKDDTHEHPIRAHMAHQDKHAVLARHWLQWLQLLDGFSCHNLHFADFPPTLLIHGSKDAVVGVEQAQHFARRIPNASVDIWDLCGHAPHWHDTKRLQQRIDDHVSL